jgi:anti-anti-sigma factor
VEPSQLRHLMVRDEHGVLILTLTEPNLQGDKLAKSLRQELLTAITANPSRKVVLDFQRVKSLSSEIFRPLVTLRHKLEESKGKLVICSLSPEVTRAFSATRLMSSVRSSTSTFQVQPNVPAAVASLTDEGAESR